MPEMPRTLTAALQVASQGRAVDEALADLAEAVELYLEGVDDPAGKSWRLRCAASESKPGPAG